MKGGLSDKQRKFLGEYLIDFNGVRAARAAGYRNPQVASIQNLKHKEIKAAIAKYKQKDQKRLKFTRRAVLEQIYYGVTRSARDFVDDQGRVITNPNELSDAAAAMVDSIEQEEWYDENGERRIKTKLRLVPKAAILDMAMRHKGLFAAEKHQHEVKGNIDWEVLYREAPIVDVIPQEETRAIQHDPRPDYPPSDQAGDEQ